MLFLLNLICFAAIIRKLTLHLLSKTKPWIIFNSYGTLNWTSYCAIWPCVTALFRMQYIVTLQGSTENFNKKKTWNINNLITDLVVKYIIIIIIIIFNRTQQIKIMFSAFDITFVTLKGIVRVFLTQLYLIF